MGTKKVEYAIVCRWALISCWIGNRWSLFTKYSRDACSFVAWTYVVCFSSQNIRNFHSLLTSGLFIGPQSIQASVSSSFFDYFL